MANAELMSAIRSRLRRAADPARAAGAQAYLKSEMPSLGVRVPEVRRIVKAAARELPPGSLHELQSTVLELWRGARLARGTLRRHRPHGPAAGRR